MRKLIIIPILFACLVVTGQTVMTKKYRWFVPANGDTIDPLYDYGNSTTYHYNDQAGEYSTADSMAGQALSSDQIIVSDLPNNGLIQEGELYHWNGIIVRARQTHSRTIYDPTETLALFTIYRLASPDMEWIAGEQVDVGSIRVYEAVNYECIQAHVTQDNWTPDVTPALWSLELPPSDDWQAGESYQVGDQVTYQGSLYECLQAHTAIVGWQPPNVPALWRFIE